MKKFKPMFGLRQVGYGVYGRNLVSQNLIILAQEKIIDTHKSSYSTNSE